MNIFLNYVISNYWTKYQRQKRKETHKHANLLNDKKL